MPDERRSHCPIVFALDLIGDKWSLIILRDILFKQKTSYQEFINSEEMIATNILANRLQLLEKNNFLLKTKDPNNKKKYIYSPTKKALDLLPMIIEIVLWSAKYDPDTGAPAKIIKQMKQNKFEFINDIRLQFDKKTLKLN